MKIKHNLQICTEENYNIVLKMYAEMAIARGVDGANDWLFENMLTNEVLINLMFFFAVDNIQKIIENSPAENFRTFNQKDIIL